MSKASLNKAQVIGNLGADPDLRYTKKGVAVANFRVATSEAWKNGQGQQQEQTEWHRIIAFGRLGEICGEYLGKGQKVFVEGKLQTRKWQDRDGHDRYTTEIVARDLKMLSSRPGGPEQEPPELPPGQDPQPGDDVPF